jgi:hypothetical protein
MIVVKFYSTGPTIINYNCKTFIVQATDIEPRLEGLTLSSTILYSNYYDRKKYYC